MPASTMEVAVGLNPSFPAPRSLGAAPRLALWCQLTEDRQDERLDGLGCWVKHGLPPPHPRGRRPGKGLDCHEELLHLSQRVDALEPGPAPRPALTSNRAKAPSTIKTIGAITSSPIPASKIPSSMGPRSALLHVDRPQLVPLSPSECLGLSLGAPFPSGDAWWGRLRWACMRLGEVRSAHELSCAQPAPIASPLRSHGVSEL